MEAFLARRRRSEEKEKRSTPRSLGLRNQAKPQKPWGLSREDMKTIDSITDPGVEEQASSEQSFESSTWSAQSYDRKLTQDAKNFTHVNSSGEARMVDVGPKPDSKRVAIAVAYVVFSNPEPMRLIFENNNKKGDVLGVARIAGIMAAKRTSDLIPLCHPIVISKVEVELNLDLPGCRSVFYKAGENDAIAIRALVECTGQTGVEMEALTAATGAALTVFDMCKAVDREIRIKGTQVVYKSGGKSGLHFGSKWALHVGRQFFEDRGLAVPDIAALTKNNGKGDELFKTTGRDRK